MKKMMFLLLATVFMLSACSSNSGSGASSDPAKKEITVWAWDPNFNIAALNLAKERYMAKHPDVKINIVENAQADIVQKLNTGLNSGTTKGLPNIVLIEDYRSQNFLQAYPDAFRDMSDSIKGADFADYKAGPTSYNGKQYGVPFDSGVTGMYVRTDYLKEAGYTPEDMQDIDWDKFIEIGKAVKAKTGKDMLTQDPNDLGLIRAMIQSAGSWYLKEDGKTPNIAGNAALKEAMENYKAMFDANIVKTNSDWSQFLAAFNSGAVASVPTGNWITPSIKAEASQSGKWAVVPFPKLKDTPNSVHASNIGGSSWYVMNVDGQDTAADFMKETFGSDKELYQDMLNKIGIIGTLKSASSGSAYDKADEFFGGQKIYADFAKWTTEVPNVNYGLHTYAIEDIMTVEVQNYLAGKDIDSVLNDVQAQAEAQLK
ncbi:lactose/L-arabinose transport system substrate-binding protein [Paenibacillus sp. SORGH_AS306]|uniref:ABC transporter substrate-binding protein n=1 Tax=unclassified Paenibacillus TaxID=185978 RepID=UPI0027858489|nr:MULTISPECIES: extracellular solute-binding protein [unclassified Paenibacillus]MDQ1236761.1 lactose/L-arabinose transport system substrate-binding protein [Paenibacillus sp. SORGH_AS_0306]MDR6109118.1 lactose/L-arabinose transport system substrate-binding protein [Paenibacillus sp. SORGH_AS_0338]